MPIRTKYRSSINLMKELNVKDLNVWEENGFLQVSGRVNNNHDLNLILEKIREENLDNALDINVKLTLDE